MSAHPKFLLTVHGSLSEQKAKGHSKMIRKCRELALALHLKDVQSLEARHTQ